VVERAVDIGDRDGLEAVTFKRLSDELGVTQMAVHRHVIARERLLTEMLATTTRDFDALAGVDPHLPWTERLRAALLAVHAHNRRHPVLGELLLADSTCPAEVYRTTEQLIGLLVEAGFQRDVAADVVRVIQLQQAALLRIEAKASRDRRDPAVEARRAELRLLDLPASDFPSILASATHMARLDVDMWRELAADIIVGGVAALLPADMSSEGRKAATDPDRAAPELADVS
jgi:AcrR family transcriptional regulator